MNLSNFDEAQQSLMLWAKDASSGKRLKLSPTDELMTDFSHWLDAKCGHSTIDLVGIKARGGSLMYRRQCIDCGAPQSQWVSKSKISLPDAVALVESDLHEAFERKRTEAWRSIQQSHVESQVAADQNEYAAYLLSDIWRSKRSKVLKRANGICEGCGENPADQVHHLTYKHVEAEFLWELVAICKDCHDRVHADESS